jgi:hypothetical protein
VTEDLTYDLDVRPGIDLSARVTVPKRMGSERFGCNTTQTSVVSDAVANGPASHWLVGHIFSQENVLD